MKRVIFSLHLKSYRKVCNLSQEALASKVKCSPSTISRWELGLEYPKYKTFQRLDSLLEKFGISYDELEMADKEEFLKAKEELLELILDGRLEEIEKSIVRFEKLMDEENSEHRQYHYLALLMYMRKKGMSMNEFLERSAEIFEMSKKMPNLEEIDDIENMTLSRIEFMIIFRMGEAYYQNGDVCEAEAIFRALMKNGLKWETRYFINRSVALSTKLAKILIHNKKLQEARECLHYSFFRGINCCQSRNLFKWACAVEDYFEATEDAEGREVMGDFIRAAGRMMEFLQKKK